MAMVVKNNQLATVSLGELNKNIREKGKQITRLATGQKIVGAADGASEWSISEKMRTQIRGLDQDIDNTKKGSSLLKVAAGGVENILEELRSIRELAINAANDHNSDADRLIIQKDIDQRKSSIEDIAVSTNYNGKPLLMGDYAKHRILDYWIGGSGGAGGEGGGGNIGEDDIPAPYQPVSTGVIEPNDPPTQLPSSGNITTAGVYTIPTGFTGTITIADGLVGVKLQGMPSTTYTDVYIEGPSSGNANLWLENVNITNSQDKSAIKFSGSNNVLTTKGNNKITPTAGVQSKAIINAGAGLTLEGSGDASLNITPSSVDGGGATAGATIGSDADETTNNANITINSGNYNMVNKAGGAVIGTGTDAHVGNITINGGNFTIGYPDTYGAPIGAGCGASALAGDIVIKNAKIDGKSFDGTIGTGLFSSAGNITIDNSLIKTISTQGAGIGSGEDGHVLDITITNSLLMVKKPLGSSKQAIGAGASNATAGAIKIENSPIIYVDDGGQEPVPAQHIIMEVIGKPLIIHTGTKANQHIRCYIEDMRPRALGILDLDVTTQKKAEFALGTMAKENWHHPTKKYEEATPDELNNPDNYMGSIDKAISYTLDQATMLGAYISRLDTTEANLTTNSENTQSSESVIRDADMAAEMTAMAKANILTQSSQAMLAQANQISSNVLDLLG